MAAAPIKTPEPRAANLTTSGAVSEYLSDISLPGYDFNDAIVTKLTGGSANYIYLIKSGPSPVHGTKNASGYSSIGSTTNTSSSRTAHGVDHKADVVLKHSQPFVANAPNIPFSIDRQTFEAAALTHLPSLLLHHGKNPSHNHNLHIRTPELLLHDPSHTVLIFPSAGSRTLKSAYVDPTLDTTHIGTRLGIWLANLHSVTRDPATASNIIGNNTTARSIYRFSYTRLASSLSGCGFDSALGEAVNERYGALLATDDECQCHGDFWPGNVVVGDDPVFIESETEVGEKQTKGETGEIYPLTVIDWEMTRRGHPATDVGQFAAEAFLLDRFHGQRNLFVSFLRAYFSTAFNLQLPKNKDDKIPEDQKLFLTADEIVAQIPAGFLERMGVHLGSHLVVWPQRVRVKWTDEEGTREVVGIGRRVVVSAMEGGGGAGHGVWLGLLGGEEGVGGGTV